MVRNWLRPLAIVGALCMAAAGCASGDSKSEETAAQPTTDGPVRLQLSASAKEYVQGQPVRLTLVLTNQRDTPFHFERIGFEGEPTGDLFLSTDGKTFSRCEVEPSGIVAKMERASDTVHPGGSMTYRFRALYGWRSSNALALIQPGRVWLQMRVPLTEVTEGKRFQRLGSFETHSNAIAVRIREAIGDDAAVWKVLRQERFLRLLQTDFTGEIGTVREAFDLAKAHPACAYHAGLKATLHAYYRRASTFEMRQSGMTPEVALLLEDIRKWPRIPNPDRFPFPEDNRLGAKFTHSADEPVEWSEACAEASRLTKVPLSVAPEFASRTMSRGWRDGDLRGLMRYMTRDQAEWIRDGDGYKLSANSIRAIKASEVEDRSAGDAEP